MPLLLTTIEEYFLKNERDIFILHVEPEENIRNFLEESETHEQIKWFNEKNIQYFLTSPMDLWVGWHGQLYVEFDGPEDPLIQEYSAKFEDEQGKTINPKHFQLFQYSYADWVAKDGPAKYKEYKDADYT